MRTGGIQCPFKQDENWEVLTGEEEHRGKSNVTNKENSAPTFLIKSVLDFGFQFE